MKQFFNARSPLWPCVFLMIFFAFVGNIALGKTLNLGTLASSILAVAAITICASYLMAIARYNCRHPKHPVKYWGLLPAELKDEDEGMRMFTARATRRVYIYHSVMLPLAGLGYALLLPSPVIMVCAFALLAVGQVVTYWIAMWPVFRDKD